MLYLDISIKVKKNFDSVIKPIILSSLTVSIYCQNTQNQNNYNFQQQTSLRKTEASIIFTQRNKQTNRFLRSPGYKK